MITYTLLYTYEGDKTGYRDMLFPTTTADYHDSRCTPSDRLMNLFHVALQCGLGREPGQDSIEINAGTFDHKPIYDDLAQRLQEKIDHEISVRPNLREVIDFQGIYATCRRD